MPKRTKDFEGCFGCRKRKVKCDKSRPQCERCLRIDKECPGYSFALVWVTPNHDFSKAQGRGGPCAHATWRGWPILKVGEIESLLLQLDESPHQLSLISNQATGLFSVFNTRSLGAHYPSMWTGRSLLQPVQPPLVADWDDTTRRLFHHYTNHVSPLMMPLHSHYNPWATKYPSLALENPCVRHALLGQAAAHLFHSECDPQKMKLHSLVHRGTALKHLQRLLYSKSTGDFEIKTAAILSLIMADIYFGVSNGWTSHVFGAIEIAVNSVPESPWLVSEMAWLTAQSLSLLYLRAKIDGSLNTAQGSAVLQSLELSTFILTPVSSRSDYGFTIGASQQLATSLAECAAIVDQVRTQQLTENLKSKIGSTTQRLLSMTLSSSQLEDASKMMSTTSDLHILHIHIFALGLLIRLLRSISSPKPSELLSYTESLFKGVQAFREVANAASSDMQHLFSPTLWPVFHGAVELYRPADQEHACRIWLNELDKTAIGNRKHVQAVVEKTWLTRKARARLASQPSFSQLDASAAEELSAGAIIVDWLEIAKSMGLDLLLV